MTSMVGRSSEVDVSQQQFDAWWPRVCETGAEFLRRSVPHWGDARYLWDLVELDESDPGPARLARHPGERGGRGGQRGRGRVAVAAGLARHSCSGAAF